MNYTLLLLALLAVFIAIDVPIAIALGASAVIVGFLMQGNIDFVATILLSALQKIELLAIPFFILAGNVLDRSGIMVRLFDLINSLVGRVPARAAIVGSAMSVVISGLSGSGPADTAGLASTLGPVMDKRGYSRAFTAALVSAGAGVAIVVPPSIAFILYGIAVPGVSIGEMFVAGILPGIVMGALIAVAAFVVSVRRGYDPKGEGFVAGRAWTALRNSIWGLAAPVVIVGGIYFGIFTPTEAAGVAVIYGLIIGSLLYREIGIPDLMHLARVTALDTAVVMLIIACASLFAWVITIDGRVVVWVMEVSQAMSSTWQVFFLAAVVLLIAGLFIDGASIYLVLVPLLMPAVRAQGIDLNWFGIFVAIAIGIGQFTPPVGVNLFVAARVLDVRFDRILPDIMPFLLVSILGLVIIYLVPGLSTWLPQTMRS